MSLLGERIKGAILRVGESFTISMTTYWAVFRPPFGNQVFTYLDTAEVNAAVRPILFGYVAYDNGLSAGVTITLDGRDYTVFKVVAIKVRDEISHKILVLA